MNRLAIPIVAVALLTAACGGAATLSSSKDKPTTVAGKVQINGGANSGSDVSDITNRPNPPIRKAGTVQPKPAAMPQTAAPTSPFFGSAADRCGTGIGTGLAGNRAGTTGGKRLPLPMCAVQ
jgi:hypothetical protein